MRYIVTILLLLAVSAGYAQDKDKKKKGTVSETIAAAWAPVIIEHHVGLRGGYGMASARFEPIRNTQSYWGLINFGLAYRFDVPKQKYVGCIEADISWMEKGYKYETYNESGIIASRRYSVIEIPILWQPYLPLSKSGHSRFYLSVGPFGSYALSSTHQAYNKETGVVSEEGDYSYDVLRDNRWEFGIVVGGGLVFGIGRFGLGLEYRYNIGLSDIYKSVTKYPGNPFRSPVDQMNVSVQLNYKFSLGVKKDKNNKNSIPNE